MMPLNQGGPPSAEISISVVVPTLKSRRTIKHCLLSILRQTYRPAEIVVVDQGSDDGTREIVEHLSKESGLVRYSDLGFEQRGISHARNFGAKQARGRYVLFVDSDWYLDPGALERLARLASQGKSCLVVGAWQKRLDSRVSYIARSRQILWEFSHAQSYLEHVPCTPGTPRGTPYFMKREDFLRIGGFDCLLPVLEDADLNFRCMRHGIIPGAAVDLGIHDQTITLRATVVRRLRSVQGAAMFEMKWQSQGWVNQTQRAIGMSGTMHRFLGGLLGVVCKQPLLLPGAVLVGLTDGFTATISKLFLIPRQKAVRDRGW